MTKLSLTFNLSILLGPVLAVLTATADENKSTDATPAQSPLPYQVKVVSGGMAEMGKAILLGIYGDFGNELSKELGSEPDTVRKNLGASHLNL
jgi:hypothetical protein